MTKGNLIAVQLKYLYNEDYSSFDGEAFKNSVFDDSWEEKELKQRMHHISLTLGLFLKATFCQQDTKYALENMIFQNYVEVYGLDYFDTSMDALASFTIGSSSEFAIRQFILKNPNKTMLQNDYMGKE